MANGAILLYSTNKLADQVYVKAIFSLSKTGKTFFSTNAISAAAFDEKKKHCHACRNPIKRLTTFRSLGFI